MRRVRQILWAALVAAAAPAPAQTIVLDTFDTGSATGSPRTGTSWVGQVTQNPTSITVGGTATDVNGWGATGLTLNATGMNFLTITAQRNPASTAAIFALQFEDRSLVTRVVSVNAAAFAVATPTKVQIPLPTSPAGFSLSQIVSWSLGGGDLGTALWSMTVDLLSLDSVLATNATLAPSGSYTLNAPRTGTDGLKLHGSGTLILGAANTFSGDIVATQGTLQLGATGALPGGASVTLGAGTTLNLAGFAATLGKLDGAGNIALGTANLTVAQAGNSTYSGVISGTGGLIKNNAGALTLTGTHTFSGATEINGGQLRLNGSAANSAFTINGGTFSGNATIGALTLASGGTLSPGNSPGVTQASHTEWQGGGAFTFEINQRDGTAGGPNGWDLLNVTGSLSITATSGSPFSVGLTTLTFANASGVPQNFSATGNYAFAFVTTSSGIIGFNPAAFTLNAAGVDGSLLGTWSLSLANSNRDLQLIYTGSAIPEPSTYAALVGLGALVIAGWRRKRGR